MADFPSTNNQNQTNVNNVNSNGITLFSAESHMLRIGFKNDTLMISIRPKVMGEDGRPRWPKDGERFSALRPWMASALYNQVVAEMLPYVAKKEDYPGYITVPTNRDNTHLVGIGYQAGRVTFNIFNNVGSDCRCSDSMSYTFDTIPVISQYDPTSGKYSVTDAQGQFHVFLLFLNAASIDLFGAPAHGAKVGTYYNMSQIVAYIRAIAAKMGVTPSPYGNYRGYSDDGSSAVPWTANNVNAVDAGTMGSVAWSMGGIGGGPSVDINPSVTQVSSLDGLLGAMTGGTTPPTANTES